MQAEQHEKIQLPKAIPDDIKEIVGNWAGIVTEAEQPLKVYLKNAHLSLGGDNRLIIVVEDGLAYDYLSVAENQSHVENMISEYIQKEVTVRIEKIDQGSDFSQNYIDLGQMINMDIEIEEE